MGNSNSSATEPRLRQLIQKMTVIRDQPGHHLLELEDPQTKKQYMLRDITIPNKEDLQNTLRRIEQKRAILQNAQHVLPIVELASSYSAHFCSSVSKVSMLCQYPQRTLDDETGERHLQKRRYNEKELWTIVASCILGMAHLQRNRISHEAVRSSEIFIENTGLIQVADPYVTGALSNWEAVTSRAKLSHIYLSPELGSQLAHSSGDHGRALDSIDVFKSDVFSLGMVLLETGLLEYQDDCYASNGGWLNWEKLARNYERFSCLYSEELSRVVSIMLDRDPSTRESWIELENYVRVMEPQEKSQRMKTAPSEHPTPHVVPNLVGSSSMFQYTFGSQEFPQKEPAIPTKPLHQVYTVQAKAHSAQPVQQQQVRSINLSPPKTFVRHTNNHQPINQNIITGVTQRKGPVYYHSLSPNKGVCVAHQQVSDGVSYLAPRPQPQLKSARSNGSLSQSPSRSPPKAVPMPQYFRFDEQEAQALNIVYQQQEKTPVSEEDCYKQQTQTRKSIGPQAVQYVVETFKQGSRYEGFKFNNMRHGKGKFFYQDGGLYDGQWVQNKMTGFGRLYYQSGKLAYEGNWLEDTFNGLGVLYNENAHKLDHPFDYANFERIDDYWTTYEGYFKGDLKHGRGKLHLSNDEYYEGNFCDDAIHGFGTFFRIDGRTITGRWEYNHLIES